MATFTNQATLTFNDTVINSNIVTGELLDVLSATKTAVSDTYLRGDTITYAVSISNTGSAPFTGLTVTDNLGAYTFGANTLYPLTFVDGALLYYVNGVLQPEPTVAAGSPLVITGINVPAGGNALIVYTVTANEFAPIAQNGTIANTATVSGGGLATPIEATETVTAANSADLSITKAISPVPVSDNETLTYTFTIQNNGNTPVVAIDDVVLTDIFDPILTDLAVVFNGTTWTEPLNYTYNDATGLFRTVEGQITVPAATYTTNPDGSITVTPGVSTLTVSGTV
ncbi:MAG: hypothetical protein E7412_05835 [Ruminococcaceae bacterium]|nr:hypothetical protein [Oscillospiraceae bacterium]